MSSALQSSLAAVQQTNYAALAALTATGYDYFLVFPKEVEYIWNKPWTRVSTLFIVVRYCGLYNLASIALDGSSFVPVAKVCAILSIVQHLTYILFLGAADFVMILRVWAIYSRSRLILGMLLALLSIEIISVVVAFAAYSDPENVHGGTIQVLGYSACWMQHAKVIWARVTDILQMAFAAVLCMLPIVQFVRQSWQMYHVTKRWRLNQYVDLLVKQGTLYFVAIFLLVFINLLSDMAKIPGTIWQVILTSIVEYVPVYVLTPRFIISIRELHAYDIQGRRGSGLGIDTGFGLSSSYGGIGGPIVFANDAQSEVAGSVEEADRLDEGTGDIENVQREVRSA